MKIFDKVNAKTSYDVNNSKKPSFLISIRFLMSILLFLGWGLNYMQKIDMGIAIVCMVNHTAVRPQKSLDINQSFANFTHVNLNGCNFLNNKIDPSQDGPFVWDKKKQGLILSAFFYGYMLTQFAGGLLSFFLRPDITICLSLGIGSLITILIPFFARWSYIALIVCLFFAGAAHGVFIPSTGSFWAPWAPTPERSRLIGISYSGANLGKIIALSVGGFLCAYGFDGGWPSIFYLIGIAGVVWTVVFFFLASKSPDTHRFISQLEKDYIKEHTKKSLENDQKSLVLFKIRITGFIILIQIILLKKKIPWRQILKTKACYSIFIGNFTHNWGVFLFLTEIPSYLKDVYAFDMKANGLISSIPYIASWLFIYIASFMSDLILKTEKISLTNTRRIFTGLGTFLPALTLIGLSFVNCSQVYLGISLLTLGVACMFINYNRFIYFIKYLNRIKLNTSSFMSGAGFIINVNDISGPFSGIIFGISNTFGSSAAILGPYTTGLLTTNHSAKEWQVVFLICAAINIIGGFICIFLLDANIQPWARVIENVQDTKTNEIAAENIYRDQNK